MPAETAPGRWPAENPADTPRAVKTGWTIVGGAAVALTTLVVIASRSGHADTAPLRPPDQAPLSAPPAASFSPETLADDYLDLREVITALNQALK